MNEGKKKYKSYNIVDYKLINSILGLNKCKYSIYQKDTITKQNEEYLNKINKLNKSNYQNLSNSIIKLIINKKNSTLEKENQNDEQQEKILWFGNNFCQKYNKSYNRYIKQNQQISLLNKIKKTIKIQNVFRSYLFRKQFFKEIIEDLKQKCISSIIKIQCFIRQKQSLKLMKIKMLNHKILLDYKEKEKKIENLFKSFYNLIKFKEKFLLKYIIKKRYNAISKIQSNYRGYIIHKKIKNIILKMKTLYTITYPFYAQEVEIKIYVLNNNDIIIGKFEELQFTIQTYKFEYNPILKFFILFIENSELKPGKYRCQLIVNNIITCDGRFPHIEFSDGKFYNLITFKINNNLPCKINDNDQESNSDDYENTNQSLNNGIYKFDDKRDDDDFSSYEDLKTNLESDVYTSRMDYIKKKSLTELFDFD